MSSPAMPVLRSICDSRERGPPCVIQALGDYRVLSYCALWSAASAVHARVHEVGHVLADAEGMVPGVDRWLCVWDGNVVLGLPLR